MNHFAGQINGSTGLENHFTGLGNHFTGQMNRSTGLENHFAGQLNHFARRINGKKLQRFHLFL